MTIYGKKILSVLIACLLLTGCSNKQSSDPSSSESSSTSTPIAAKTSTPEATPTPTPEPIVIEQLGITSLGDLVIKITNNTQESMCVDNIQANCMDAAGNAAYTANSDDLAVIIPANGDAITYFSANGQSFSDYTNINFTESHSNATGEYVMSGIDFECSDDGSSIVVSYANNSENTVTLAMVDIVFYSGNQVVGVQNACDPSVVGSGESSTIYASYPFDANGNYAVFDRFEAYYVNARII